MDIDKLYSKLKLLLDLLDVKDGTIILEKKYVETGIFVKILHDDNYSSHDNDRSFEDDTEVDGVSENICSTIVRIELPRLEETEFNSSIKKEVNLEESSVFEEDIMDDISRDRNSDEKDDTFNDIEMNMSSNLKVNLTDTITNNGIMVLIIWITVWMYAILCSKISIFPKNLMK